MMRTCKYTIIDLIHSSPSIRYVLTEKRGLGFVTLNS